MRPTAAIGLSLPIALALVLLPRLAAAGGVPPGLVWVPPLPDPVVPTDENAEKAAKAYKESVKLYEADKLLGSFEAADRMYQLLPNASTALYRAELLEDLGDPCEALAGFLVSFDLDPTEDEEPDIEAGLNRAGAACAGGYGWARIGVTPANAEATSGSGSLRIRSMSIAARELPPGTISSPGRNGLAMTRRGLGSRVRVVRVTASPDLLMPRSLRIGWRAQGLRRQVRASPGATAESRWCSRRLDSG